MRILTYISKAIIKVVIIVAFNIRNFMFLFMDSYRYPMVSVVVPLYNEERFIIKCLDSVKMQRYRNLECIIVNDCSTDNSKKLVQEFIASDDRFRLVEHETNRGLSAARNTGIKHAKGSYITFLDSDDFLLPNSVWRRVYILANKGSADDVGSYCSVLVVPESGKSPDLYSARFWPSSDDEYMDFITCRGECPFPPLAPLMKTDVIRSFGGFSEDMKKGAEDWEMWSRIMRFGYQFIPSGSFGGAYRQKPGSMVRAMPVYHVNEALKLINQAYSRLPEEIRIEGTPYVFREPIGYYDEVIVRSKRLIHYAAMAYMSGDDNGFNEIVGNLMPGSAFYIERHVSIDELLDMAIARYLCIGLSGYEKRRKEFTSTKKEIHDEIIKRISAQ